MSGLILQLSFLQSPVFLINSRLGHFSASHLRGRPFSQSYRSNLPSSLATDHSSASGFSPRPPVSVCGTGRCGLMLRGFSRKSTWGHCRLRPEASAYCRVSARGPDFPGPLPAYALQRTIPSVRSPYVPSSPRRSHSGCRNVDRLAIGFALRLILRSRLTLF